MFLSNCLINVRGKTKSQKNVLKYSKKNCFQNRKIKKEKCMKIGKYDVWELKFTFLKNNNQGGFDEIFYFYDEKAGKNFKAP